MRRGPDHFYAHVLKLESAAPELVHIEEVDYNKVDAIGMQSILHLRGN